MESTDDTEEVSDDNDSGSRYAGRNVSTSRVSGRSGKRDAALKDQQSTGRKRAARMYPLNPEGACEWRGKANCGGGTKPIVGCLNGNQQARHHGPDKSTSNNEQGNVHRICHRCHYNWHAANDGTYDWNETIVNSHLPHPQSEAERAEATFIDLKHMAGKTKRIKD